MKNSRAVLAMIFAANVVAEGVGEMVALKVGMAAASIGEMSSINVSMASSSHRPIS